MSGSCLDLREFQDSAQMQNILGKLVSGKSGYKAVIDKTKPIAKCQQCGKILDDSWKFCPECGNKLK